MAVRVVEDWLNACSGCEISILNIGDPLLDILPLLEFHHMTALVDHKFFGQIDVVNAERRGGDAGLPIHFKANAGNGNGVVLALLPFSRLCAGCVKDADGGKNDSTHDQCALHNDLHAEFIRCSM